MKDEKSDIGPVDEVVDRLLRDHDYLLARELRHKAEELNQLFLQARRQKMKIELSTTQLDAPGGDDPVTWLEMKIYKEI